MLDPATSETTSIAARFVFAPDRANEFLEIIEIQTSEGTVTSQPTVTEMEFETVEELMEVLDQFSSAILDCHAIVNGKVVSLTDFSDGIQL